MGQTVAGQVVIQVRANLTEFKAGMTDASGVANKAGKDMAEGIGGSMRESVGSMRLLEGELGIHIPRELNRVIASIPGVQAAFSAMLPLAGAFAAIAVIYKLVEAHTALMAKQEEARVTVINLATSLDEEVKGLELTNLKLDDQIAKLDKAPTHNFLKEAILENAIAMDKLATRSTADFQKMSVDITSYMSLFGELKMMWNSDLDIKTVRKLSGQLDAFATQVQTDMRKVSDAQNLLNNATPGTIEYSEALFACVGANHALALASKEAEQAAMALGPAGAEAAITFAQLAARASASYRAEAEEQIAAGKRVTIAGKEQGNQDTERAKKFADANRKAFEELDKSMTAAWKHGNEVAVKALDEQLVWEGKVEKAAEDVAKAQVAGDEEVRKSKEALASAELRATAGGERNSIAAQAALGIISKREEVQQIAALDQQELSDARAAHQAALGELQQHLLAMKAAEKGLEGEDKAQAIRNTASAQVALNAENIKFISLQTQLKSVILANETEASKLNSSWKNYFKAMSTETKDLGTAIRVNLQTGMDHFIKGFGDGISKAIVEGKSLGAAVKSLAKDMAESLISMLVQWLEKWVMTHTIMAALDKADKLSELAAAKAQQVAMTTIAAGQAGAYGVASFSEAPWPIDMGAPAFGAAMFADALSYAALAEGGATLPGRSYLIGEKGPELWTPGATGFVTPNHALSAAAGAGGGNHTSNFNISTPNADSFRRSQSQIQAKDARSQAVAHRRNN